jgi:HEPN domain-containing protein
MEQPAFVIPQNWRDERYLIAVWYSLPFCLYLPYDHYPVTISRLNDGRPALIELDKRRRDPEIAFKTLPSGKGENWQDPAGKFRYSTANVWMPYTDAISFGSRNWFDLETRESYASYALQYLNRLVRVYRFVTADYYVPTLSMEDVDSYFGVALADTASPRPKIHWRPMGRMAPDVNLLPDTSTAQLREIRGMLRSEAAIPDEEELLMSARALLESGSPRLAVLDAQTAFEVVVKRLVAADFRARGYSPKQIQHRVGRRFNALLKKHLSPEVKRFEKGMPEYDHYWARTYQPRCDLVHGEKTEITHEDAEQAIRAVEEALEYLTGRPHDKLWPPPRPPLLLM